MRTVFWSIIAGILILTIISLALYSGEEEVLPEPIPENISKMLGGLRDAVDAMEDKYTVMNEIVAIACAGGKTANAKGWFGEAERTQARILKDFNNNVLPLSKQLENNDLNESAQKQLDEFMGRAYGFISIETDRDILVARNAVGLDVASSDWMALAGRYRNVDDVYDRNMGLKALGETVEKFDRLLANRIYDSIDAPFVRAIHKARNPTSVNAGSLFDTVKDPYLLMQVLITYGRKNMTNVVIGALKGLLDKIDDDIERGYFASRMLQQLPNMPEKDRTSFFAAIEENNDLLMIETKLSLLENGGALGTTREEYLEKIKSNAHVIVENYPRENILARIIKLHKDDSPEAIFKMLEDIESTTLREEVLVHIALNKNQCTDADFDLLIEAMEDSRSKLTAKLDRFNKSNMTTEDAVKYLLSLEGYAEEVKDIRPHIALISAWGKTDPLMARQRLQRFGTQDKVSAGVALSEVCRDNNEVSIIVNDLHTEVAGSKMLEPLEKSQLLRQIAEPAMKVSPLKAVGLLEEAYRLVI